MTPLQTINAILSTIGRNGNPASVAAWKAACVAVCGLSTAMRSPLADCGDVAFTRALVRDSLLALEAEARALPFDDLARAVCYLADLDASIWDAMPAVIVAKARTTKKARAAA